MLTGSLILDGEPVHSGGANYERFIVLCLKQYHATRPLPGADGPRLETVLIQCCPSYDNADRLSRSGTLYYKPDLSRSCCPYYTIRSAPFAQEAACMLIARRLKAAEFHAKREQRQAVHRLNNHILGVDYRRKAAMLCPRSRQQVHGYLF